MSLSKEWTEWHLTPEGWKRGTEKIDFRQAEILEHPINRVLTCIYKEHLSSAFSSLDKSVEEKWRSGQQEEVDILLKKFGSCPESL